MNSFFHILKTVENFENINLLFSHRFHIDMGTYICTKNELKLF